MMISTKGRYALRVMIEMAESGNGRYMPMKEIASRQGISLKYLEQFIPALSKSGLIEGVQGKGGGYRLTKKPEEYTVGDILRVVEGDFAPVSCLECGAKPCERAGQCRTLSMWKNLQRVIEEYFDSITLHSLMNPSTKDAGSTDVEGQTI